MHGLVSKLDADIILTVVPESFVSLNRLIDDSVNICGLGENSYVAIG